MKKKEPQATKSEEKKKKKTSGGGGQFGRRLDGLSDSVSDTNRYCSNVLKILLLRAICLKRYAKRHEDEKKLNLFLPAFVFFFLFSFVSLSFRPPPPPPPLFPKGRVGARLGQ